MFGFPFFHHRSAKDGQRLPALLSVGSIPTETTADIVFVHGLWGDPVATWQVPGQPPWSGWVAHDIEGVALWTLHWNTRAAGASTPSLPEVADAVLNLLVDQGLGRRPLIFITHSLGGLLVRQLLKNAETLNRAAHQRLARQTKCVIFFGSPHQGASLAKIVRRALGRNASRQLKILLPDSFDSREIERWYSANRTRLGYLTTTFYEGLPTYGIKIVDRNSAELGYEDDLAVVVEADHFQVCKIPSRDDHVYLRTVSSIRRALLPRKLASANLDRNITDFINNYRSKSQERYSGGGRTPELGVLTTWLADKESNRLVLTGPAGIGKSHLLVNWTQHLVDWNLVFVPISLRFRTNEQGAIYRSIASQLANVLGEVLPDPTLDAVEFYKAQIARLVGETESVSPLLIVIDGLDEALGAFDPTVFPTSLPTDVKIVVAARLSVGDVDSSGWTIRLGWNNISTVQTLTLGALQKTQLRAALQDMGAPTESNSENIVNELFRVTQGDPLLLRFYAEDIAEDSGAANLRSLRKVQPGLDAYFKLWLEQMDMSDREAANSALAVLACAHGPLDSDGLTHLSRVLFGRQMIAPLATLKPLRRFVWGDGSSTTGFVITHPKFAEYLREQFFTPSEVSRIGIGFADWAREEWRRIKDGVIQAEAFHPYLVRHYVDHLRQIEASIDEFAELVDGRWFKVLETTDDSLELFGQAVRAVFERLPPTSEATSASAALALRIKAALCMASLKSIGGTIPAELAGLAVKHNLISIRYVMRLADLQPPENQIGWLEVIAGGLSPDELDQAIAKALMANDPGNRAQHLVRILASVSTEKSRQYVDLVPSAIKDVPSDQHRVLLYLDASSISGLPAAELVQSAKTLWQSIVDPEQRCHLAARIAGMESEGVERRTWIDRTLTLMESLDETKRANAIMLAQENCPAFVWKDQARELIEILSERAQVAEVKARSPEADFQEEFFFEHRLELKLGMELISSKPNETFEKAVGELVQKLPQYHRTAAATRLVRLLSSSEKQAALETCRQLANSLPTGNNRTHALLAIAKEASGEFQKAVVRDAMESARLIEDSYGKFSAMIDLLAAENDPSELVGFLVLFNGDHTPKNAIHHAELLSKLSELGVNSDDFLRAAENLVSRIVPKSARWNFYARAIERFPPAGKRSILEQILPDLVLGRTEFSWLEISFLADSAAEYWSIENLQTVLTALPRVPNRWLAGLLASIAPVSDRLGGPELIQAAIDAAANAGGYERLRALCKLALSFHHSHPDVVQMAKVAADEVGEAVQRINSWIDLLPVVSDREAAFAETVTAINSLQGDARFGVRLRLLKEAAGDVRETLFQQCRDDLANFEGEQKFGSLFSLLSASDDTTQRLALLDEALQIAVARSSLSLRVGEQAKMLVKVGGKELSRNIRRTLQDVSEWWP